VAIYEGKAWLQVGDLEAEIHTILRSGPELGGGWWGGFATKDEAGQSSLRNVRARSYGSALRVTPIRHASW
jgi:hypothetical protein